MYKSFVDTEELIDSEPSLSKFSNGFDKQCSDADNIIISRLHNDGIVLRTLCLELPITEEYAEDKYERMRMVIEVNSSDKPTSSKTIILYGKNSDEDSDIEVATIVLNKDFVGVKTIKFNRVFKYYKADLDSYAPSKIYLIETTFDLVKMYCSLWLSYQSLIKIDGDIFSIKAEKYESMFEKAYSNLTFRRDVNEDGDYSDEYESKKPISIRLSL